MRSFLLLAVLALGACDLIDPAPNDVEACHEFTHKTIWDGKAVNCLMLWCERGAGVEMFHGTGLAMLRCVPQ